MIGFTILVAVLALFTHGVASALEKWRPRLHRENVCLAFYAALFFYLTTDRYRASMDASWAADYLIVAVVMILHAPYFSRRQP